MKNRILSLTLSLILVICAVSPVSYAVSAASYSDTLRSKGFPESYIDSLVELHSAYPKWDFEVFNTGLKWQTAVEGERSVTHTQQVIEKTSSLNDNYYCDCSKCKKNGSYVIQLSPNWVCASEAALKYYMDPRNWLDAKHIFQFESTAYNSAQTQTGVEAILSPTWMHNSEITYKTTSGKTKTYTKDGASVKYSKVVMDAAKNSGMSAYYLASKIVQEVGSSTASYAGGSCGTRDPFLGIYNYYNIGAYNNATNGLEWASGWLRTNKDTVIYSSYDSTKDTVSGTKTNVSALHYCAWMNNCGSYYKVKLYTEKNNKYTAGSVGYILKDDIRDDYITNDSKSYGRPWSNPYRTIYYGAEYIANGYAKYQYTGYLQKYNVNKNSGSLYGHEYTTTVAAPSSESVMTYNAYNKAGLLSQAHTFYIPVYNSMPSKKCIVPSSSSSSSTTTSSYKLTLKSRTKEQMSLSWTKYSGASKYYLYIKNKTKGTTFNKTVDTNSTTIKGLTAANEYYIKIKPYVSGGYQSYYVSGTFHALPPKVTGVKASKNATTSVTLSWSKVAGADGYHIYKYNTSSKKYTKLASASSNTYKVTGLTSGTKYTFAVAAYTKDVETKVGAKSALVSTYTKPKKVTLKSVTSPSGGKIKATWSKVSGGATGYQVVWYRDSKYKNKAAEKLIKGKSTVTYTGKGFTKGKTYYVRVRAYKTVDGKKVYGAWSSAKKIKCK